MAEPPISALFPTGKMKNKAANISNVGKWAAVCSLILGAASVYAEEEQPGLGWLKIVAFANHQIEYSGIFVYQHDNRVETSSIIHLVEPDGEYEKLESLDGPKREIIRHNGQVWCYINHKMVQMDSKHPQIRSRFTGLLPEQLSVLSANYQAKEVGFERVAGYNAQAILFEPRDNLRYAHKIWVHADTGLLLKAVVLGDKERVVEQYAFTQLQLGGNMDRSWTTQGSPDAKQGAQADASPEKNSAPGTTNSGWVVDALPAGFRKTMEIQRPLRGRHAPVTQMVFSDGLSAISIFIEPDSEDDDDSEGLYSRGAVNMYHKVIDKRLFTVVGEVPPRTLMQVFQSIRYNGKGG